MQINDMGYNATHYHGFYVNRPKGNEDFTLFLFKTNVVVILNGTEHPAGPNTILLLSKGTPQIFYTTEHVFINDWMHFEMSEAEISELKKLNIPFDTLIPLGDTTSLSKIINLLHTERFSENLHKTAVQDLYFKLLLLRLSENLHLRNQDAVFLYRERLTAIRTEIYSNPAKNWTVSCLAEKLMLSKSYFQHLYKRCFGTSAISDVIASRIEHAKYILSGTDFPISYVAKECGYKSDVQLIHQFKAVTGMTPTQYRKQK